MISRELQYVQDAHPDKCRTINDTLRHLSIDSLHDVQENRMKGFGLNRLAIYLSRQQGRRTMIVSDESGRWSTQLVPGCRYSTKPTSFSTLVWTLVVQFGSREGGMNFGRPGAGRARGCSVVLILATGSARAEVAPCIDSCRFVD
jgi:hypothetical protein